MSNAVRNVSRPGVPLTFLASLVAFAAAACHTAPATPPPPLPSVLTTTVQARPEPVLTRRGAVTAGARLRLGFNAAGVIASVAVATGDVVREGQPVARLKDGDAAAGLRAARANRTRALREYRAAESLVASGAASKNQRDEASSALEIAEANVAVAAEVLAQRQLASPIAGTVLARVAEPGEAVGPGMPVLVIESTRRLVVKVGVNEREYARVTANQPATLMADGHPAAFPALVTSIAPAPGDDGLYAVEVTPVAGQELPFHPGTLVTVRFGDDAQRPAVRVPLDAIVYRDDKQWVFVVVVAAGGATTTAVLREVFVERWDGKDGLVRSTLKNGDQIVREGAYFLQDGQAIRVLEPAPAPPIAELSQN